jgi:hypothetical protein
MLDREIPLKWALPIIVVGAAILVFGIWTTFIADVAIESHETDSRNADFFVQTSNGAPKVCQLHFMLLYRDHSYKRDAPAGLTGSLSWNEEKGIIGLYLKIIGGDFSNGYSGVQVPFKVFDGLVLVDGKPLFPQKTFPCEDQPTGYCGGYILQKSVDIYRALAPPRSVAIAFRRKPIGPNIAFDIPVETLDSGQFQHFNKCMGLLTQRAQGALAFERKHNVIWPIISTFL